MPHKRTCGFYYARTNTFCLLFTRRCKYEPWHLRVAIDVRQVTGSVTYTAWEVYNEMVKRPEMSASSLGAPGGPKAGVTLAKFPLLKSFLCDSTYEGSGEARMLSTLIIRGQGTSWTVKLADPSTGLMLRAVVDSYDLVHGALEALLGQPNCPWEHDPYARPTNGRGKRRKS